MWSSLVPTQSGRDFGLFRSCAFCKPWKKCVMCDHYLRYLTYFQLCRYLATGMSQKDIARYFRLGRSTVSMAIPEVCQAIWKILGPIEIPPPTLETWLEDAAEFDRRWNFPRCLGKHSSNIQGCNFVYFWGRTCNPNRKPCILNFQFASPMFSRHKTRHNATEQRFKRQLQLLHKIRLYTDASRT